MTELLLHNDHPGTRRVRFAAAASAAAGAIHLAAAVPHFADDVLLGGGFVLVGWLQILLAVLLFRGHDERPLLAGGLLLQLGSIGAWAVSRTVGLPLGHPGVEPVALPDFLTVVFEGLAVAFLVWRFARPHAARPARPVVLAGLVASWLLVMTGSAVAVADLGRGGHGHETATADHHGGEATDDHHATDDMEGDHHDGEAMADDAEVLHVHDDGSLHLHATGEVHQHDDGTAHVHDAEAADVDGTHAHDDVVDEHDEPATEVPAGHDNSDGHHDAPAEPEPDGHTHAPGEEH